MAGKKGQKKRFWSDDEKRSICAQTTVPGISVAQVARRYAMNANLIHNWLKDARFVPEADINAVVNTDTGFLPVEIADTVAVSFVDEAPQPNAAVSAERVDITLSDGRRILVEGPTALAESVLKQDPYSGHLFVFRGRRGDLVKIVWWDGQGACMFSKRLEKGRYVWPAAADGKVTVSPAQLSMLLEGIDWRASQRTWQPLTVGNLEANPAL